ncbi:MAG: LytTR family DNA-binding domain-containing protein [Bacteroidales bacterium]|nr:LytTR family DNA-binding domain-containing protein [Bacteroidales bacterium]MDD4057821.1 LytTR family DNA-binding domain-containing protein [Bacteroidales bacterium]
MKIPDHILKKVNIVRLVIFTAAFALLFINIYKPFGSKTWYNVSDFKFFLFSAPIILTGVLVVVISRIIMYYYSRRHNISYVTYLFWVFFEILFMSLFYTIFTLSLEANQGKDVILTFKSSMVNTSLVLLLPYITLWFYFGWEESKKRLSIIEDQSNDELENIPDNILFTDDKRTLRLSVRHTDLLYIESDDNYVTIHYLAGGKIKNFLLRNTLKKLEEELMGTPVTRCHRSYLVNFSRVKVMRRERENVYLELDTEMSVDIPVSKSYREKVAERFMNQSFRNKRVYRNF